MADVGDCRIYEKDPTPEPPVHGVLRHYLKVSESRPHPTSYPDKSDSTGRQESDVERKTGVVSGNSHGGLPVRLQGNWVSNRKIGTSVQE